MHRLGVNDLLQRFQDGSITCEAYTRRVIQRSEDLKIFNYFISMDTERMLRRAQESDARYRSRTNRPLEGIPIAIKDNIDIEGEVSGAGTPGLALLKSKRTAEVALKLFDAGAIHAGRVNMHELAYGVTTMNAFTGASHNFHNFDYICGGSSGGSGGVVAADIVPAALGTDTGGSIRIPASYNGVFGLRPTIGYWPADYGVKMTHLRDSVGPLARSSEDLAILDSVMSGKEVPQELSPAEIQIGVPRAHFWENLHPDVSEYAEEFLTRLRRKGFVVIDKGEIPEAGKMAQTSFAGTIDCELIPRLEDYLQLHGHKVTAKQVVSKIVSPDVKAIIAPILANPPTTETLAARGDLIRAVKSYFEEYRIDCILMPANKVPPPAFWTVDSDTDNKLLMRITENDDLASVCNNPSLVIPGGFARVSGAPFGMQIEARTGNDRRLIAVAMAIEKSLKA